MSTVTDKDAIKEALQRYLDVDVAADEWDEPPNLVLIIRDGEGVVEFGPVPIGSAWDAAEPYMVVRAAADIARKLHEWSGWTPFEERDELLGVALFTEGWGVIENTREATDQVMAWMQEGHRLSEHPLAIEVKMVTAVFPDDTSLMLMHARGDRKMPVTPGEGMEGRVPAALNYLLATFLELEEP